LGAPVASIPARHRPGGGAGRADDQVAGEWRTWPAMLCRGSA